MLGIPWAVPAAGGLQLQPSLRGFLRRFPSHHLPSSRARDIPGAHPQHLPAGDGAEILGNSGGRSGNLPEIPRSGNPTFRWARPKTQLRAHPRLGPTGGLGNAGGRSGSLPNLPEIPGSTNPAFRGLRPEVQPPASVALLLRLQFPLDPSLQETRLREPGTGWEQEPGANPRAGKARNGKRGCGKGGKRGLGSVTRIRPQSKGSGDSSKADLGI